MIPEQGPDADATPYEWSFTLSATEIGQKKENTIDTKKNNKVESTADSDYGDHGTNETVDITQDNSEARENVLVSGPPAGDVEIPAEPERICAKMVEGPEAEPKYKEFDEAVISIKNDIVKASGPEAEDFRQIATLLETMRSEGLIKVCETKGISKAHYDNKTRQIRLSIREARDVPIMVVRMIHEGAHALHAKRNPKTSTKYGVEKEKGAVRDRNLGILLLKWRAWTEYWAYRRQFEYANMGRTDKMDASQLSLKTSTVTAAINEIRKETKKEFDPATWAPPG